MLFDLRAPGRKRLIQAVYLVLAIVLVGGTVLFGVGTGLPGLFSGDSNTATVDVEKQQQERLAQVQRQVAADPKNEKLLIRLASLQYAAAASKMPENAVKATPEVRRGMRQVEQTWERYLALDPDPVDTALANKMIGVFAPDVLNQPAQWADVQGIITREAVDDAERRGDPVPVNAYLQLLAAQTAAKRTRLAKITEQTIRASVSPSQKKIVEDAIKKAKDPNAQSAGAQAGTNEAPQTITVPEDEKKK